MTSPHPAVQPTPDSPLLSVKHLSVEYPASDGKRLQAVSDVSFDLMPGETLGLVGESGCGKTSAGRAILQLLRPSAGEVIYRGANLVDCTTAQLRSVRKRIQMIFQDPISSLNPRLPVWKIVAEGLEIHRVAGNHRETATAMLRAVGIDDPDAPDRRPDGFSGGQCQRISIARSLLLEPEIIVCDEPVSALDVSVQAQILNLLEQMKQRFGLSLLFISHDLSVVRNVSDRVAIMYLGKFCEVGDVDDIFMNPAHPYTVGLLDSVPSLGGAGKAPALLGEPPSPIDPPSGCRFRTRCPYARDLCAAEEPRLLPISSGHAVACHFPIGRRGAASLMSDHESGSNDQQSLSDVNAAASASDAPLRKEEIELEQ